MKTFGVALREARRDAKETLLSLASSTSPPQSVAFVSQVERGEKNPPSEKVISAWLQKINCGHRIKEFLDLARISVRHVQVSTKGKSPTATNVLTALARNYEEGSLPEDVWKALQKVIEKESERG